MQRYSLDVLDGIKNTNSLPGVGVAFDDELKLVSGLYRTYRLSLLLTITLFLPFSPHHFSGCQLRYVSRSNSKSCCFLFHLPLPLCNEECRVRSTTNWHLLVDHRWNFFLRYDIYDLLSFFPPLCMRFFSPSALLIHCRLQCIPPCHISSNTRFYTISSCVAHQCTLHTSIHTILFPAEYEYECETTCSPAVFRVALPEVTR